MTDFRLDVQPGKGASRGRRLPRKPGSAPQTAYYLMPNIDADQRTLPKTVKGSSKAIKLDHLRASKSKRDDEYATLKVHPRRKLSTLPALELEIAGDLAPRTKLFNGARALKPRTAPSTRPTGGSRYYPLTTTAGSGTFRLESFAVPGSPRVVGKSATLEIILWSIDSKGKRRREATVHFVAPVLRLSNNLEKPERIYICAEPDNEPTRFDLKMATKGYRLVTVPSAQSGGDAWLQDQLKFGVFQVGRLSRRAVLHLPRVRHNSDDLDNHTKPNLSRFVAAHFPSKTLGLINDLREVELFTGPNTPKLGLEDSHKVYNVMNAVTDAHSYLWFVCNNARTTPSTLARMQKLDAKLIRSPTGILWSSKLTNLPALHKLVHKALADDSAKGARTQKIQVIIKGRSTERDHVVDTAADVLAANTRCKKEVERQIRLVLKSTRNPKGWFAFSQSFVRISYGKNKALAISFNSANTLLERLEELHDSINYGGNIEVLPPNRANPDGQILIGTSMDKEPQREFSDVLEGFLEAQKQNKIVEIDTTWLNVAHVDEIVTPVPDHGSYALLRASPGLAMDIVHAARDRYFMGLKRDHPHMALQDPWNGTAIRMNKTRRTDEGKYPVTRLLRGKFWLHDHLQGNAVTVEPPAIYQMLATRVRDASRPYFEGPLKKVVSYHADLSVLELAHCDRTGLRQVLAMNTSFAKLLDKGVVPVKLRTQIEAKFIRPDDGYPPKPPKEVVGKAAYVTVEYPGSNWIIHGPWTRFHVTGSKQKTVITAVDSVNAWIEHHHIAASTKILRKACPGTRILPLPVIFDTVENFSDWEKSTGDATTGAFTPNLANMVVIGRRIILPRPFGPRVPAGEAIALLRPLLARYGLASAGKYLNHRFIRDENLKGMSAHLKRQDDVAEEVLDTKSLTVVEQAEQIASLYRDGFPKLKPDKVKEKVLKDNATKFDGQDLKSGWQTLRIREETVDLFELWCHLVARTLRLRIKWVDTWYYHLTDGEIHCATQVLRR